MGKTCKLKDVSFQCMTKFTTNKKKKNKNKNKNKKNKMIKDVKERKQLLVDMRKKITGLLKMKKV